MESHAHILERIVEQIVDVLESSFDEVDCE